MGLLKTITHILGLLLSWPTAAIIFMILFRKQIVHLFELLGGMILMFGRVRRLRGQAPSVRIAVDLDSVGARDGHVIPPGMEPNAEIQAEWREERFRRIVAVSPRAGMVETWIDVEHAILAMGQRLGRPDGVAACAADHLGAILTAARVSPVLALVIDDLQRAYHEITDLDRPRVGTAHITARQVYLYRRTADMAIRQLIIQAAAVANPALEARAMSG